MKEGNELHDVGLNNFHCIGYHLLDEHAMQAFGSSVF